MMKKENSYENLRKKKKHERKGKKVIFHNLDDEKKNI